MHEKLQPHFLILQPYLYCIKTDVELDLIACLIFADITDVTGNYADISNCRREKQSEEGTCKFNQCELSVLLCYSMRF